MFYAVFLTPPTKEAGLSRTRPFCGRAFCQEFKTFVPTFFNNSTLLNNFRVLFSLWRHWNAYVSSSSTNHHFLHVLNAGHDKARRSKGSTTASKSSHHTAVIEWSDAPCLYRYNWFVSSRGFQVKMLHNFISSSYLFVSLFNKIRMYVHIENCICWWWG